MIVHPSTKLRKWESITIKGIRLFPMRQYKVIELHYKSTFTFYLQINTDSSRHTLLKTENPANSLCSVKYEQKAS